MRTLFGFQLFHFTLSPLRRRRYDSFGPIEQRQKCIVAAFIIFVGLPLPAKSFTHKKKVQGHAPFTLRNLFSQRYQAHKNEECHDEHFPLHRVVVSATVRFETEHSWSLVRLPHGKIQCLPSNDIQRSANWLAVPNTSVAHTPCCATKFALRLALLYSKARGTPPELLDGVSGPKKLHCQVVMTIAAPKWQLP